MPTYIRVKDLPNAATSPASDDFILLSGAANGARRISRADFLSAVAGFYTADPSTYKLATLDAGNKVLVSQLPSSAFSYQGTWAASTNTPTLANGTGTAGDVYYASDSGSVDFGAGSISFLAGDAVVYDGSVWEKVPDVVNLLDGKGTLDEAKTTLEIPDVGTSPNEVPLSGQLGTMAFQDSAGVSVGTLEADGVTTLTNTGDNALRVESTNGNPMFVNVVGSAQNYLFDVRDDGTSKVRVDGSGRVGIGTASPNVLLHCDSGGNSATNLKLEANRTGADAAIGQILADWDGTTVAKIALKSGSDTTNKDDGEIVFETADAGSTAERWRIKSSDTTISGTSANTLDIYRPSAGTTYAAFLTFDLNNDAAERTSYALVGGRIADDTDGSESGELVFRTRHAGGGLTTRWSINSSGNLVSAGGGIDFGSAATSAGDGIGTTGTVSNQVLSDYEFGSWEPEFSTSGTNFATITTEILAAQYVKVGRYVHCQANIRTDDVDATGATGGVIITGLPFVADTSSGNYGQLSVGYSGAWVQAPDTGYIDPNNAIARLFRSSTTGTSTIVPSNLTSGTTANQNQIIFSLAYIAST